MREEKQQKNLTAQDISKENDQLRKMMIHHQLMRVIARHLHLPSIARYVA